MRVGSSPFGGMPPVVKNLLIINVIFYFASIVLFQSMGIRMEDFLGLHIPMADKFGVYQLVTYMFLHAYPDPAHIFFNMFALFMFGRMLETVWGSKRFLFYYMATGIGAALVHLVAQYYEILPMLKEISFFMNNPNHIGLQSFLEINNLTNSDPGLIREYLMNYRAAYLDAHVTVGASGAVFGILLAFGMLFPNMRLMLLFPPIPIKAKYFVIMYGVLELFLGVANFSMDNVAHFAHLGGMLFGFLLIKYWQKKGLNY